MSYIVAVTGGIGSGKSTLSALFAPLGVPIVETDSIARQLVAPETRAFKAVVGHFGAAVLQADNQLNRGYLRDALFNDAAEKAWLEQLLHPLIYRESWRLLKAIDAPYALWVVPLLTEKQWGTGTQRTLVVDVSLPQQLTRLMLRDQVSHQQAQAMLSAQCDRQNRLAHADDIIDNNGDLLALPARVMTLHQHYLKLAATRISKDADQ